MLKCFWILLLHIISCLSQLVEVTQDKFLIVQSGKSAELKCWHTQTSYLSMFWYQQKGQQGLKLMVYSTGAGDNGNMEEGFGSWALKRSDVVNSTLTMSNASAVDSAVYFCAVSQSGGSSYAQYFGGGTVLHVLETNEQQKPPQVKIFPPNKKEFKDHNLISLVCVASGFYPEHVRLNWTINGEPRNGLYQNVASKNKDGKSFSTSKRLTLTRSEYFNPDNKFRCEAGFIGNSSDAFDEVNGESDCGVSKESYAMYINQGKISYIMVLFKSGLYALIVLAIIWRRKVLSGSC